MTPAPVRRVVLLGFMASGKTTVGRELADLLGWAHLDLDREIEREQGRSIAEIFAREGEDFFRGLEAELTVRALAREHTVLSPGGGWVTNPSLFGRLPADALSVWLQVSPEEVVRRVRADPHAAERPLLRGDDPAAVARRLLALREPLYHRASVHIPTEGRGAGEIAQQLLSIVRGRNSGPR